MYKTLYTFLNNNNIIYNLQFGFTYALINITGNIRKALDEGRAKKLGTRSCCAPAVSLK